MHRADHREPIGVGRELREDVADLEAALAMPGKAERGRQRRAGLPFGRKADRRGLVGIFGERRLRVEGVDLRRAAIQKEMDHALRTRGEVGGLHRQRLEERIPGRPSLAACLPEDTGEPEQTDSQATAGEEIATREREWREMCHRGGFPGENQSTNINSFESRSVCTSCSRGESGGGGTGGAGFPSSGCGRGGSGSRIGAEARKAIAPSRSSLVGGR